jgi:hypothetical protein
VAYLDAALYIEEDNRLADKFSQEISGHLVGACKVSEETLVLREGVEWVAPLPPGMLTYAGVC